MTEPLSFFTVDRGTGSISAALIGLVAGRFRLLAASSMPATVEVEAVLADLVARVRSMEPRMLPSSDRWPSWVRLEVATAAPRRIVCAAGDASRARELADAFARAGWDVDGRSAGVGPPDPLSLAAACSDRNVQVLALAAGERPASGERSSLGKLVVAVAAAVSQRDDLQVILSGGAALYAEAFPADRVTSAPMPRPTAGRSGTPLHDFAASLAYQPTSLERPIDGRAAYRAGVASLAALLGRHVDAIDIGRSAGSFIRASADGQVEWMVHADGALVPAGSIGDEAGVESILRWSSLRSEDPVLQDRVRDLEMAPWRDSTETGTRVRAAALRAACARLSRHWSGTSGAGDDAEERQIDGDLMVASGGALAAIPPGIAALAVLDAFRRPGTMRIIWDHARILAPIGAIGSETDRQHLLTDLVEDALIPLASALVTEDRVFREAQAIRFEGALAGSDVRLTPGSLTAVDLPPGLVARAEVRGGGPRWLGRKTPHVTSDLDGGLAGLLIDSRPLPLTLPDRIAARCALIADWERPFWPRTIPVGAA